ncbi:MAG: OmpH family outer membrane protein [Treponema sp.]|nr:OmpH family outer membrane protein [Treponema sp.]
MLKKNIILVLMLLISTMIFAQQKITQFGVVDTARVYKTYFRESTAIRNYEKRKNDFQAEINKQAEALEKLQSKKVDLQNAGKENEALKVDSEIQRKARYLTEYTKAKNIELENIKKRLESSNEFYERLYDIIGRVAEAEGLSMILNLTQANGILWYSPTVDITDKVINELSK